MAWAQQSARVHRIAILQAGIPEDALKISEGPFLQRLAELGYAEGRNLVVERRYAGGKLERLPALAAELLAGKPDLIFAPPASAAAAAKALAGTIPIVFCFVSDPVALGFAQTLARPGGNMTGMSNFSVEVAGKRVEFLRQMLPRVSKLAIWYNPDVINDDVERRAVEQSAARLGMRVLGVRARNESEFAAGMAATRAWGADSIYFNSNPVYNAKRRQLIEVAATLKIPAIYFLVDFVTDGGLVSYAADFRDLARRAASHADRILRGAKPGELPVEQPNQLELTVNLKTARQLGIAVPAAILVRADRVIE